MQIRLGGIEPGDLGSKAGIRDGIHAPACVHEFYGEADIVLMVFGPVRVAACLGQGTSLRGLAQKRQTSQTQLSDRLDLLPLQLFPEESIQGDPSWVKGVLQFPWGAPRRT